MMNRTFWKLTTIGFKKLIKAMVTPGALYAVIVLGSALTIYEALFVYKFLLVDVDDIRFKKFARLFYSYYRSSRENSSLSYDVFVDLREFLDYKYNKIKELLVYASDVAVYNPFKSWRYVSEARHIYQDYGFKLQNFSADMVTVHEDKKDQAKNLMRILDRSHAQVEEKIDKTEEVVVLATDSHYPYIKYLKIGFTVVLVGGVAVGLAFLGGSSFSVSDIKIPN